MTLEFASRPQGSPLPFGEPTDARTYPEQPLGIPPMEKFIEASRRFDTTFMPDYRLDT